MQEGNAAAGAGSCGRASLTVAELRGAAEHASLANTGGKNHKEELKLKVSNVKVGKTVSVMPLSSATWDALL